MQLSLYTHCLIPPSKKSTTKRCAMGKRIEQPEWCFPMIQFFVCTTQVSYPLSQYIKLFALEFTTELPFSNVWTKIHVNWKNHLKSPVPGVIPFGITPDHALPDQIFLKTFQIQVALPILGSNVLVSLKSVKNWLQAPSFREKVILSKHTRPQRVKPAPCATVSTAYINYIV